jgi:hypothetical protein
MKPLGIALVVFALAAALRADVQTVEFVGVTYRLESVGVAKDGVITNEYVRAHASADGPATFLTISYWPKAKKVGEAAGPWLNTAHEFLMEKPRVYRPKTAKSDQDVIFEVWLYSTERTHIRIILHRFVMEPGSEGVKAYQLLQKIPIKDGKGDPTYFIQNRDMLFSELGKTEFPVHRKKD